MRKIGTMFLKQQIGKALAMAEQEPLGITRIGQQYWVMLSAKRFQQIADGGLLMLTLRRFTTSQLKMEIRDVLAAAGEEPVEITRHKQWRWVVMNAARYQMLVEAQRSASSQDRPASDKDATELAKNLFC